MSVIERLPLETRSRLRSTQILTTLAQIVSELVQNAIDAGATHVDVALDIDSWACTVADDGPGIPRDALAVVGSERYHTSKAYSSSSSSALDGNTTFGFRGEALASIGDLSCLEIVSQTSKSESWSAIIKGGQRLHLGRATRHKLPSSRTGTVISVRDAFYNLPVRRSSHPTRTLDLVKREIETYSLGCPGVAFSLDTAKSEGSRQGQFSTKVLVVPATNDRLATFRRLYGRALAEEVDEINVGAEGMRMKGFISLHGAISRSHQFLFINRHPANTPDLTHIIDSAFARSTFGKHAYEDEGKYTPEKPGQRRSPRKLEKHPVYVLDITLPSASLDSCLEPSKSIHHFKNLPALTAFVSAVVRSFLEKHGFLKRKAPQRDVEDSDGSPRKKARRTDLTRSSASSSASSSRSATATPVLTPLSLPATRALPRLPPARLLGDNEMEWVDPTNGRTFIVDARTGSTVFLRDDSDDVGSHAASNQRVIVDTSSLRQQRTVPDDPAPEWFVTLLDTWENPTFQPGQRQILAVGPEPDREPLPSCCGVTGNCSRHQSALNHGNLTAEHTFTREDLRNACVIGQVDAKYIACVVPDARRSHNADHSKHENGTLVLIDQHAADERVRVEQFLQIICNRHAQFFSRTPVSADHLVALEEIDDGSWWPEEPIPVLLTRQEVELARTPRYLEAFASWGLGIEVSDAPVATEDADQATSSHAQILVHCVPDVVAEKILQGNELQSLVKSYLAALHQDGAPSSRTLVPNASWHAMLRLIPRHLLDLINSKACRGAIMFGDTMRVEQCERLVSELADSRFPFQCAHGRPSIAPLTQTVKMKNSRSLSEIQWDAFAAAH